MIVSGVDLLNVGASHGRLGTDIRENLKPFFFGAWEARISASQRPDPIRRRAFDRCHKRPLISRLINDIDSALTPILSNFPAPTKQLIMKTPADGAGRVPGRGYRGLSIERRAARIRPWSGMFVAGLADKRPQERRQMPSNSSCGPDFVS